MKAVVIFKCNKLTKNPPKINAYLKEKQIGLFLYFIAFKPPQVYGELLDL